ncbi:aminoglycoside phosphotransferase family protein [Actinomadura sp. ATCC 31491]|uniref:Aminoglycoside phosphotransferase family protein n=1 Tax=Actinomadura luzonensis TaxID=2805427 RepID=A0ABT0G3J2_9ACTN|nr:aminoglycoside phosphotransferase family protein [Actinomadura luzonensis]MCK2219173.1 aminoglycoside phosphotransferase family protein [Actinomadura luzonensis]
MEERLDGRVNEVVRVGATVRRLTGPWTPAVHALLDHLAGQGFTGAPRAHGTDPQGREVLDHLPGDVPDYPLPGWARADAVLADVARLLRAYHDATAGFPADPAREWYFPPRNPVEVICHGDVAPYNTVFREGRPVAFIDFDTAHPGPRVWDVAYAAYRFVPLSDPRQLPGFPVDGQARRLRLFADAYGLDRPGREALPDTVRDRLAHLVAHMREQAAAGHPGFAHHLERGDDRFYLTDDEHLARHRDTFRAALLTPRV